MTAATSHRRKRPIDPPLPKAAWKDARTVADVLRLPPRRAVAIDGTGAPGSAEFQDAVRAAYGVTYTLKFAVRAKDGDFKVGPLEAMWWTDDDRLIHEQPAEKWRWRLRLAVPDAMSAARVAEAIRYATSRKGGALEGSAVAARVILERIPAARVARVLHVGPYAAEADSFAKLLAAADAAGYGVKHRHVEIYLNDPRRTAPERLRTVLLIELVR